ncbi:hypothetical protein AURDEDRAFT_168801 [Auricularia subglabra TFB-10046 SS5]|nr:hypothetical protein AURDEDRAFT_168801 [Auricularia subglabra TFB-10046 SS5]
MPSKHQLAAPLLAPVKPHRRFTLDQTTENASDSSDDSAESDWEEGRTLIPPEDDTLDAASEQHTYLLNLVDSLAEPFAQKAASHKRHALATLEPALDFTAVMHAQLATAVDAPFLCLTFPPPLPMLMLTTRRKGVNAFDESAGRVHGAVVRAREDAPQATAELRALFTRLSALLKTRDACVDKFRADVAAEVDALRRDLEQTSDDLDKLEKATDRKEKALVKQAKEGGVAKRDADKLIKQLLEG